MVVGFGFGGDPIVPVSRLNFNNFEGLEVEAMFLVSIVPVYLYTFASHSIPKWRISSASSPWWCFLLRLPGEGVEFVLSLVELRLCERSGETGRMALPWLSSVTFVGVAKKGCIFLFFWLVVLPSSPIVMVMITTAVGSQEGVNGCQSIHSLSTL